MLLIKKLKTNSYLRNFSYMGGAELVNRAGRLANTAVLARILSVEDYGVLAIIFIVTEFSKVLTLSSGIGTRVLSCTEEDLSAVTNTCSTLNWCIGLAFMFLQVPIAFTASHFYHNQQVLLPIMVLGLMYICIPLGQVQFFITWRRNKIGMIAKANMYSSLLSNILTPLLALGGFGVWSVVIPQIINSLFWGLYYRFSCSWRGHFSLKGYREVLSTGVNIIGVELLNKLRANLDYILIGAFLNVTALGSYYFAFNAGLGISLSIISGLVASALPVFVKNRFNIKELKKSYRSIFKTVSLIIGGLVLVQTTLAPFYVPIVFGEKWRSAVPILIVICLSALSRPFAEITNSLFIALDKTRTNLIWETLFTIVFSLILLLVVKQGVLAVAIAVCITHWLCQAGYVAWAYKKTFKTKEVYQ